MLRRPCLAVPAAALRSLASIAVVALSLAACTAGSDDGGWWSIGFGHAAQAAASPSDGETATGSYLAGRAALDAGDLRGAAQGFEAALAAAPDNLELRRQVFALLLSSGELDRALEAARDLSQRDAAPDEAVLLLGLDAAKRGADAEALRLLEGLGRGNIAGPVQPILVAWARFASGARAQAIDELAVADPNSGLDRLRGLPSRRHARPGRSGRATASLLCTGRFPIWPRHPCGCWARRSSCSWRPATAPPPMPRSLPPARPSPMTARSSSWRGARGWQARAEPDPGPGGRHGRRAPEHLRGVLRAGAQRRSHGARARSDVCRTATTRPG